MVCCVWADCWNASDPWLVPLAAEEDSPIPLSLDPTTTSPPLHTFSFLQRSLEVEASSSSSSANGVLATLGPWHNFFLSFSLFLLYLSVRFPFSIILTIFFSFSRVLYWICCLLSPFLQSLPFLLSFFSPKFVSLCSAHFISKL